MERHVLYDLIHVRKIKKLILNKLIIEQWLTEAAEYGRKSYLSSCRDKKKNPNKSNVRKERLMSARSSRIQSILMEKARHPTLKQLVTP